MVDVINRGLSIVDCQVQLLSKFFIFQLDITWESSISGSLIWTKGLGKTSFSWSFTLSTDNFEALDFVDLIGT